jgi:phospholipase/carboxylesterase
MSQPRSEQLLECIVVEPDRAADADAAVIWLHGLGATYHDFPPVVPELRLPRDHGVRFVFPQAPSVPVTVNGGMVMPAWYDILGMDFERRVDEAGVRRSAAQLAALVARENGRGVASERIVVAGFSQGGAIALHLGVRHPERLGGVLALSTYLACDGNLDSERSPANAETPILMCHGHSDPMVPLGLAVRARERLRGLGYEVDWREYPMAHEVCGPELRDVGAWLGERLA